MDQRSDPFILEKSVQLISLFRANHIEMIYMRRLAADHWQQEVMKLCKPPCIDLGETQSFRIIPVQVTQFDAENGGLDLIKTRVPAADMAHIPFRSTVLARQVLPFRPDRHPGHDASPRRPPRQGSWWDKLKQAISPMEPAHFPCTPPRVPERNPRSHAEACFLATSRIGSRSAGWP